MTYADESNFDDDHVEKPVEVGASALPDTIKALLRVVVTNICTFLVAKGYVNAENADGILTTVLGLATLGWSLYATFYRKKQLVAVARDPRVPEEVATLK